MTWPLASSTSLLLNIQRPRRRKQVAHEAELGTGPMRGLVRPCHPVRARARATSLGVVAFVFAEPAGREGGGGRLKKSAGSCDFTACRSRWSGRRRLKR